MALNHSQIMVLIFFVLTGLTISPTTNNDELYELADTVRHTSGDEPQCKWARTYLSGIKSPSLETFTASIEINHNNTEITYIDNFERVLKATYSSGIWSSESAISVMEPRISTLDNNGQYHYIWQKHDQENHSLHLMYSFDQNETEIYGGTYPNALSLQVDSSGTPHVVFVAQGGDYGYGLIYARLNGAEWVLEKLAGDGSIYVHNPLSLALDLNDRPHISYMLRYAPPWEEEWYVMYAFHDGSEWQHRVVDGGPSNGQTENPVFVRAVPKSIAIDTEGRAHFAYVTIDHPFLGLRYAVELCDSDGDGVYDSQDFADGDGDTIADAVDQCPSTPDHSVVYGLSFNKFSDMQDSDGHWMSDSEIAALGEGEIGCALQGEEEVKSSNRLLELFAVSVFWLITILAILGFLVSLNDS